MRMSRRHESYELRVTSRQADEEITRCGLSAFLCFVAVLFIDRLKCVNQKFI